VKEQTAAKPSGCLVVATAEMPNGSDPLLADARPAAHPFGVAGFFVNQIDDRMGA
jgi:hypothetical protein